jgi:hypothetical protein
MQQKVGISIEYQSVQATQQGGIGDRGDIAIAEYARISRRGFFARATPIDQRYLVTAPLQFECTANTDNTGPKDYYGLLHSCSI